MLYFLMTFILFLVLILGMSIGYIVRRKKISGSCGGLNTLGIEKACDCDQPCEKKKQRMQAQAQKHFVQVLSHRVDTTATDPSASNDSDTSEEK